MESRKSNPTMKDVAREAGVSIGTVSNVLNGIPVGADYKNKVEDSINKLGYKLNSYAQGLRAGKTRTIAFLIPNTVHPYYGELTQYISQSLAKRNYRMLLYTTNLDSGMERKYLEIVQQNKVDGIITLSYNKFLNVEGVSRIITIDCFLNSTIPCVTSDNLQGGRTAAEQLAKLGCSRLCFIASYPAHANVTRKRGIGFCEFCVENGVEFDTFEITDDKPNDLIKDFLESHIRDGDFDYDGIFCVSDYIAGYVIHVLRRKGIRVPEDVQIIGYDGLKDYSTGETVCSSIAQPIQSIAEKCVDMVLSEDFSQLPSIVWVPIKYVSGGTTKEAVVFEPSP